MYLVYDIYLKIKYKTVWEPLWARMPESCEHGNLKKAPKDPKI